eukprot:CAMPEP_0194138906 /NCGR_PEP_ID=MMETSP0152-20130528/8656_1 /TAXON_ID=1049557 /ORGANISM="Thalassiothrix antarctica, Strain L6-D1" /LENGTH=73 /DNA_ID=CAMNT_0038836557 /DNA_START=595 /DNA_END=816 /DNA_ORIENTATION=+
MGYALDVSYNGLIGKDDSFGSFRTARYSLKQQSDGNRLERDCPTRLPQNQKERCPTITKVVVGYAVAYGRHGT